MKFCLLSLFILFGFIGHLRADDLLMLSELSDMEKIAMISTLEDDILILESEIKKCEKGKKGWIAATVVGSAGVVATGVAAGVQGAQIAKKNASIEEKKGEKAQKSAQLDALREKNGE